MPTVPCALLAVLLHLLSGSQPEGRDPNCVNCDGIADTATERGLHFSAE